MFRSLFVITFILMGLTKAHSAVKWEVGVLFLTSDFDQSEQEIVDKNILEIPWIGAKYQNLRLTIYREWKDRSVLYIPNPDSSIHNPWTKIFTKPPYEGVTIPGELSEQKRTPRERPLLSNIEKSKEIFSQIFKSEDAKRILLVFGHGFGPNGMVQLSLQDIKNGIQSVPQRNIEKPLDILWLDSCFMGNIETAFEMRGLSDYFVGSEESEFADGSPLNVLEDLEESQVSTENVVKKLAQGFIESYSILKSGSQKSAVVSSSATISAIETVKLDSLVAKLKLVKLGLKKIEKQIKDRFQVRRLPKINMEGENLVDLVGLLSELKKAKVLDNETHEVVLSVLRDLDGGRRTKAMRVPRVKVQAPFEGAQLVYGFEKWTKGFKGDDLQTLSQNFILGPNDKEWPTRPVNKYLYLTPFSPGLSEFNYYFLGTDGQQKVTRVSDYVVSERKSLHNPILWVGSTMGQSQNSDRYLGLSVLNPFKTPRTLSYFNSEFFKATAWGSAD